MHLINRVVNTEKAGNICSKSGEMVSRWAWKVGVTNCQLTAKVSPPPESGDGLIYSGPATSYSFFPQGVNAIVEWTAQAFIDNLEP
jgi:hypothetical protein